MKRIKLKEIKYNSINKKPKKNNIYYYPLLNEYIKRNILS